MLLPALIKRPMPRLSPSEFRIPFDAHVAFVWRVLRRHGVPERELEDGCQEVFVVVHRKVAEFEGRSSVRTWIYGIARTWRWRSAGAHTRSANSWRARWCPRWPSPARNARCSSAP